MSESHLESRARHKRESSLPAIVAAARKSEDRAILGGGHGDASRIGIEAD